MSAGTLYIVATPIGNLQDLSARAQQVLSEVDLILSEDTRVSAKLLGAFDLKTARESVHQHTDEMKLQAIVDKIKAGQSMAFVSDAGTPGVSDPGGKLVALAVDHQIDVVPIPGPSAVTTILSICGFPVDRFTFLGFPPHKKGRAKFFDEIRQIEHAVVIFESKHRIEKALAELPPDRLIVVGRELTKLNETIYRGSASEISEALEKTSQKGEFVIAIAPKAWR